MKLQGKVAIVTGGNRGIGLATVRRFLQEGANVIIADRNPSIGHQTVQNLRDEGLVMCKYVETDVTNCEQVAAMVGTVVGLFGRIDTLVNNAGITCDSTFLKMSLEQFDKVFDVNMRGTFIVTKAVVEHMVRQRSGVILNASSIVALRGNFGQANYASSKAAVEIFTKCLAIELAKYNINVNAIAPGFTTTPMTATLPRAVIERVEQATPFARMAEDEEIANAYCFLASKDACFITGHVLRVDGGLSLFRI